MVETSPVPVQHKRQSHRHAQPGTSRKGVCGEYSHLEKARTAAQHQEVLHSAVCSTTSTGGMRSWLGTTAPVHRRGPRHQLTGGDHDSNSQNEEFSRDLSKRHSWVNTVKQNLLVFRGTHSCEMSIGLWWSWSIVPFFKLKQLLLMNLVCTILILSLLMNCPAHSRQLRTTDQSELGGFSWYSRTHTHMCTSMQ